MAELLECVSCSHCKQQIKKFECKHFFCNECFQSKNKNSTDCQRCRSRDDLEEIPAKKIRSEDCRTTSKNINAPAKKRCIKCNNIVLSEKYICKKCSTLFCKDCLSEHDKYMEAKYTQTFVESYCMKHNHEQNWYCTAPNCNVFLCQDCKTSHHSDHKEDVLPCSVKSEQYLADLLEYQQINEQNMREILQNISTLNGRKVLLEIQFNDKQTVLIEKHDKLIKFFGDILDNQKKVLSAMRKEVMGEIDKEIKNLQSMQTELRSVMIADYHFPRNESKQKTIKLYQGRNIQTMFQSKSYLQEFKAVDIRRTTYISKYIQDTVTMVCGKIQFLINGCTFPSNDDTYEILKIYETNKTFAQDVCYDAIQRKVFVLVMYSTDFHLLKISGNIIEKQCTFPNEIMGGSLKPTIALLPNRRMLFLCQNRLKLISESRPMSHLEDAPLPFDGRGTVSSICTSPCLTQTYAYFYNTDLSGSILKYKNLARYSSTRLNLKEEPHSMTVHKNLDHIAFIGKNNSTIYLCSFDQGVVLYRFGTTADTFNSGCFVSEINYIVCDVANYALVIFNFKTQERIRYIRHNGKKKFHCLQSIVKCNSNTLFVCDWNGKNHEIYKMIF